MGDIITTNLPGIISSQRSTVLQKYCATEFYHPGLRHHITLRFWETEPKSSIWIIQNPVTDRDSQPISSTPQPHIYQSVIPTFYNFTFSQGVSNRNCNHVLVLNTVSTPTDHSSSRDQTVLTTLCDLRMVQCLSSKSHTSSLQWCLKFSSISHQHSLKETHWKSLLAVMSLILQNH